jgi:hypothetical protein
MRVLPCLQRILIGWKFLPKVKRIYARCGARSIPNFGATVQFCEAQSGWCGEMKKPLIQAAPTKISIEREGKNSEMTKVRIRNFHKSAQGAHNFKVAERCFAAQPRVALGPCPSLQAKLPCSSPTYGVHSLRAASFFHFFVLYLLCETMVSTLGGAAFRQPAGP